MMSSSTPGMMPQMVWVAESGEENDGPIVVLVHGSMDRSGSWVRTVRELRDLHTVRYDRRGYGRSIDLGPGELEDHVSDLFDVIADRTCVVAGHSYGAAIALVAAQRRPELLTGIVSFEGPMPWRDFWPRTSAGANAVDEVAGGTEIGDAAERFLRRHIGDEKWESLPEKTRAERRAEGAALLTELRSAREGGAPYDPTTLGVPVISARGTESEPYLRHGADVLAEEVPGAELAVIEGAGHGAHQSHPAEMAALIRRCLARAAAAPSTPGP
jgi:pimeloyl-ACP methyl ester carboxylesterase